MHGRTTRIHHLTKAEQGVMVVMEEVPQTLMVILVMFPVVVELVGLLITARKVQEVLGPLDKLF
jgi:hypothetical protein